MTTQEIAQTFVKLCAEGKFADAQAYWSDDVVSVEGFPGPHQVTSGRAAVLAKMDAWNKSMTVHSMSCEGPFVNGDQFSAIFQIDVTDPGGVRQTMREVALYTLRDGKVAEERFLPLSPPV